jgi:phage gpG-like protein
MMRVGIRAELKGRRLAQKKMMQMVKDLEGGPMLKAMRDSTLMVQRDAKKLAPVDTGRLRASITPSVKGGDPVRGVVGSNVKYAPFMELGTRPHWPPVSALATWARRHGKTAWGVAQLIASRGLAARRFLQGAFEKNAPRIVRKLGDAVAEIVRKAN